MPVATATPASSRASPTTPALRGGKSVWWTFVAPATANIVVSTCGSAFDTVLAVYTGGAVNALTPVVANDDAAPGSCGPEAPVRSSRVVFPATAGTTYRIAVDGYQGASGNIRLSVSLVAPSPTTTGLTATPNPSQFGQSVTFTATVTSGAGTPTGTVSFKASGKTFITQTLSGGVATASVAAFSVGAKTDITAVYEGNPDFATSTSAAVILNVNKGATTTALTAGPIPPCSASPVTFTATVAATAPADGTPTGTVSFKISGTTFITQTLSGGVATVSVAAFSVGARTITAVYEGDSSFATSTSGAVVLNVNKGATTTAVTAAPNPSVFGQTVTFTATVAATAPAAGIPTGTVTFKDGATTLGTGTLSGTSASFTTSTLSVGAHTITAVYDGDGSFNPSTSPPLTQTVNKGATTTAVTAAPNPSVFGQSVTLTATVAVTAPAAGTLTGTVTFKDGATTLGSGPVSGTTATFATSALTVGSHSITATYDGSASFNTSTSTAITLQVTASGAGLAQQDFNGDGKSDILWRHSSGQLVTWFMNGTSVSSTGFPGSASTDWIVEGVGDFNGDGKSDILWRHSSGQLVTWFMNGTSIIGTGFPGGVSTDWSVEGIGDFNGDGKADILWRHSSGTIFIWLMDGSSIIGTGSPGSAAPDWTIVGVGDFNGDGKADILWRHSSGVLFIWFMNGTVRAAAVRPAAPRLTGQWSGVGDFNGDGKADILWRHSSGTVFIWLLNGTTTIGSGSPGSAGLDWTIQRRSTTMGTARPTSCGGTVPAPPTSGSSAGPASSAAASRAAPIRAGRFSSAPALRRRGLVGSARGVMQAGSRGWVVGKPIAGPRGPGTPATDRPACSAPSRRGPLRWIRRLGRCR